MITTTLRQLPRDTRDTLFMLLVIAWVMTPLLGELPWWCGSLAAAVILWRGTLAWRGQAPPSRWRRLGLLALALAATLFSTTEPCSGVTLA